MVVLRVIGLTIRFVCELGMLAALASWGFSLSRGAAAWALALAAPLVAGLTWGLFVAPKARWPVPVPARLAIEAVLFGAATAALVSIGHPTLAVAFGASAAATSIVNAATAPIAFDGPRRRS